MKRILLRYALTIMLSLTYWSSYGLPQCNIDAYSVPGEDPQSSTGFTCASGGCWITDNNGRVSQSFNVLTIKCTYDDPKQDYNFTATCDDIHGNPEAWTWDHGTLNGNWFCHKHVSTRL